MESLSLACRVCLQCISQSNSIFDEVEYDEYMKLSLVFKKVTAIEILESETAKPTHLCPQCTERLLNAYEFLTAVLKAEKEIEQYLDKLKESDDKEELQLNEDLVIETVDVLQEIEVLEEDFLTDHESVDKSLNDIPIQNDIVADDEPTNTLETL